MGVTEKLLTHYALAIDAWDKELREGAGQLAPSEQQELKNAIAIVQQFVTTLEITANEPDATLSIDDYRIGKSPFLGPVRIDVGKHVLKLSKEGFAEAIQTVDVAAGARTPVTFRLEPLNKTALVTVVAGGAPSATIFIDGRDVGTAPFKGELRADKHTIEARAPGYVTVGETIDVQYKQPMNLVLTLSAERHEGRLRIVAPEGASIAVDERNVGSGTWEGVVSTTGGHELVVHKPGYRDVCHGGIRGRRSGSRRERAFEPRGQQQLGRVGGRIASRRNGRNRRRVLHLQAHDAKPVCRGLHARDHHGKSETSLLMGDTGMGLRLAKPFAASLLSVATAAVVAGVSCSATQPTELVPGVLTQLQVPRDLDGIEIEVQVRPHEGILRAAVCRQRRRRPSHDTRSGVRNGPGHTHNGDRPRVQRRANEPIDDVRLLRQPASRRRCQRPSRRSKLHADLRRSADAVFADAAQLLVLRPRLLDSRGWFHVRGRAVRPTTGPGAGGLPARRLRPYAHLRDRRML